MGTSQYWLTRFWLQRTIGFTYFIGFLIVLNQWKGLVGANGLLPAPAFLKLTKFWEAPSLFIFYYSDTFAMILASVGFLLSCLAISGISDGGNTWLSVLIWSSLWIIYLSFVNSGQTFYGFGWESLLLEAGFLAIFLGPSRVPPPVLVIWLFRWVAFRVMFGAGLIKIRGDECWRDLTCMQYHYETQPLPNPLSWYFHHLPAFFHKIEVAFTHFVELLVPFLFFGPRPFRTIGGIITILFQGILILSGNLSWLNYITIFITLSMFDDTFFSALGLTASRWMSLVTITGEAPLGTTLPVQVILGILIGVLSIRPTLNLFSKKQVMNTSFEPLHIVNTYGAFGSITRTRYEVVLLGTSDSVITPATQWLEYEFKGKPGNPSRIPPIVSPYHWKLDWQLWFAAMSPYYYHPWILNLVNKFLQNDPEILKFLSNKPFPQKPPSFVRVDLYEYHFTHSGSSHWWERKKVDEYLPPLSLRDTQFQKVLKEQGWQ